MPCRTVSGKGGLEGAWRGRRDAKRGAARTRTSFGERRGGDLDRCPRGVDAREREREEPEDRDLEDERELRERDDPLLPLDLDLEPDPLLLLLPELLQRRAHRRRERGGWLTGPVQAQQASSPWLAGRAEQSVRARPGPCHPHRAPSSVYLLLPRTSLGLREVSRLSDDMTLNGGPKERAQCACGATAERLAPTGPPCREE